MINDRESAGVLILVCRGLKWERREEEDVGLEDAKKLTSREEDGAARIGVAVILDTVASLPSNLNAMVRGSALSWRCYSL